MAKQILKNCKLWLASYNMSGDLGKLGLSVKPNIIPVPLFNSGGAKRKLSGLVGVSFSHEGAWEAEDTGTGGVDKVVYDEIGVGGSVMTLSPTTGAVGEPAYLTVATAGDYQFGGKHGDLFAFTVAGEAEGLARGSVFANGAITATGNGTAVNVGALTEGKRMCAALHVLAVSGTNPTLTVALQSAAAQGFASPTERGVFAQVTEAGGWWLTPIDGPVTDAWWRASFTVGGTNPSLSVVLAIGIEA